MDVRNLIAWLDRLEGDVHLLLPRLFAKAGKKTVHDFRVAVKRLRAFFDLTAGTAEAFAADEAEAVLHPVYKAAGRVRKWQLIRQTLRKLEKKHGLDDRWSKRAAKEVEAARQKLAGLAEEFHLAPLRATCAAAKSRWIHADPEVLSHRLDHHWDERLQRLHGWYQLHEQDEQAWHEARRDLKTLIYQLEALHVAAPDVPVPGKLRRALLDYQDRLGQWHDAWQTWTTLVKHGLDDALLAEVLEARLDRRRRKAARFFEAWPELRETLRELGKAFARAARQAHLPEERSSKKRKGKKTRESIFPKNLDDLLH